MLRVLIVENDRMFAKDLAMAIGKFPMELVGVAYDSNKAINFLDNELPDIVFLDIELDNETTGITVAKYIAKKHSIPFIFLTDFIGSSNRYYKEAMACNPSHYLPKGAFLPHQIWHFVETALENFAKQQEPDMQEPEGSSCFIRHCFFIRSKEDYTYTKLAVQDISTIESKRPYIRIKTNQHKIYSTRLSLEKALLHFGSPNLLQVNKSIAVYVHAIQTVDKHKQELTLLDGDTIKMGREFAKHVYEYWQFF